MKGFVSQALALMGMMGSMGGPWKSSVATGVRTTAAVLVPLVIGQLAGDTALAMMVGIGGLNVSLADIGGPYRMKAVTMGVATISLAAAAYLGTVVGRSLWLSLPLMFLLASAGGVSRPIRECRSEGEFFVTHPFCPHGWYARWSGRRC